MNLEILAGVTCEPGSLLAHEVIFAMIDIRDECPESVDVELFLSELEEGWFA